MKVFLPKQHGAWAMTIIPFWLGVVNGGFVWQHIPFFAGWIFLYLATYPMLLLFKKKKIQFYKKWTIIYMIPALFLLLFPLLKIPFIIMFGLLMIPFFIINAYYTSINKDRSLMNDFSAIFAFSIAGLASSYLAKGQITFVTIIVFITSVLFFVGCTFYVKTMIRESKNILFKWLSWGYHALLLIISLASGYWIIAIAFLPSFIRAVILYGKLLTPMKIGIYEIINSAIFFTVMIIQILLLK
ncbi:YwiC-like family protein [Neobacillus sp. DY30]|uniref:YwiC-like family protein n=1 Tax=Neobacillus sp. DY30 TaxID=3047871 RepID=UPI0024C08941|nr:YwiC-like family protein [Neobacillus sp. DY30]WHY02086.1 YwiC-like family protein [Neobacillus sp. DY30]